MSESSQHKMNTMPEMQAPTGPLPEEINIAALAEDIVKGVRAHWLALLVVMSLITLGIFKSSKFWVFNAADA